MYDTIIWIWWFVRTIWQWQRRTGRLDTR